MPGGARGRWCLRWWDHPEAVVRLSALHCSYRELLVPGGTGPGVWLRDHLDPALERLLGNEGPFATCSTDPVRHDPLDPLPTQALPEGLADISTLGGARPQTLEAGGYALTAGVDSAR